MLPNLLVIGAMKSATTSLHQYLDAHPMIHMSQEKEIDFFNTQENFQRGLTWYQNHFEVNPQISIYGESSTSYTKYPFFHRVPQRIYQTIPHVKLIYILRDPIERAISHYHMMFLRDEEQRSFTDAIADLETSMYVRVSQYHTQLQQYLDYFPLEQIHILTTNSLKRDSKAAMQQIFDFLEVDPIIEAEQYTYKHNNAAEKFGYNAVGRIAKRLLLNQESPMRQLIMPLIPKSLRRDLRTRIFGTKVMRTQIEKPHISDESRQRLVQYLTPEVDALRQLTGKTFDSWSL